MPKTRTVHTCQQCGYQSPRWLGKCPTCAAWNTFVEEIREDIPQKALASSGPCKVTPLAEVSLEDTPRLPTGFSEFDRVLGGGFVPGSVILLGGDPGIGKSTLLLGVAGRLSDRGSPILYVSGEESPRQIKLRSERMGLGGTNIRLLAETRLEAITEAIRQQEPHVVIIDSIQVLETEMLQSSAGSIGQVRACAHELTRIVKPTKSVLVIVGHVTKEGFLAGPKVLEHLVDAVLHFEGDSMSGFRLLRSTKNRFGATHELGVFYMTAEGLEEVTNPSEMFLSDRAQPAAGCMVTVSLEGSRPLVAEIQALTCPCGVGLPRRRTTGVDVNRLSVLLAVLERRVGLRQLAQQDVFVSTLGGLRLSEPGADLGITIAIASSLRERPTRRGDVAIGEVGLTGEVRTVSQMVRRLEEAKRLGFARCFVAPGRGVPERMEGIELVSVRHVKDAVLAALGGSGSKAETVEALAEPGLE